MPPKRTGKPANKMPPEGALVPVNAPSSSSRENASGALVPRRNEALAVAKRESRDQQMVAPRGYTVRKVQPAKNYDVISFARAMNPDFGPRVKTLFDPELEAALEAQQTGIYVGWRCPEFKWDCQRVGRHSRCFCGHPLAEHAQYNSQSVRVPCGACACKAFAWMASRPEDIGEFWFAKRRDFDVTTWRAKCRCKHIHEDHDPNGSHRCRVKGCRCAIFDSNFLCAACDRHWEDHVTVFEDTATRQRNGLPVGADYLPFAEIPSLRNMVLTGEDDHDMSYMKVLEFPYAQPLPINAPASNSTAVGGPRGPNMALEYPGGGVCGPGGCPIVRPLCGPGGCPRGGGLCGPGGCPRGEVMPYGREVCGPEGCSRGRAGPMGGTRGVARGGAMGGARGVMRGRAMGGTGRGSQRDPFADYSGGFRGGRG